jgi:voltage-gated potassium channel Kch
MGSRPSGRETDLLYFSLITLSTIGYGDIVPLSGEARVLAALEGVTGVLYIAITVALLVSRFRTEPSASPHLTDMTRDISRDHK